jgi:hypothetical protein
MPIDKDNPKLTQSEYERFDFAYALDLKENYPEIWKAGGNIRGNEAFQNAKHGPPDITKTAPSFKKI